MTNAPTLSDYFVREALFSFDIASNSIIILSVLDVVRFGQHTNPLVLEGNNLQTLAARMNGKSVKINSGLASRAQLSFPTGDLSSCMISTSVLRPVQHGNRGVSLMPKYLTELTWFIPFQETPPRLVVKIITDPALTVVKTYGRILDQGIEDGRPYSYWVSDEARPTSNFVLMAATPDYADQLSTTSMDADTELLRKSFPVSAPPAP